MKNVFLSTILTSVLCFSGNLLAYSGNGEGTSENPYQISSVEDCQELAASPDDWSSFFILTTDVNLAGVTITQVGNGTTPFTGVFDGNDNVISGRRLFGRIGSSGQVRDLGIENINVTGEDYVGGFIGTNGGTLIRCHTNNSVSGNFGVGGLVGDNEGTLIGCYTTGSISGMDYVGGLVGENNGTITGCYATGSVTGVGMVIGGLVGVNGGTVTACYATGSVTGHVLVGGLVGETAGGSSSIVTDCYATGSVNGNDNVGGLVGMYYKGTVSRCYATGPVSGENDVGGLGGYNAYGTVTDDCFWDIETTGQTTSVGGTGKSTVEMKTLSTFTSAGWDFVNETANGTDDIWTIDEHVDYPKLVWSLVDFIGSSEVDFEDYSFFAEQWLKTNCGALNDCDGADLDFSDAVDGDDLKIFTDHLLQ